MHIHNEEGMFYALRARTISLLNTCQTTRWTCHEREATAVPQLWPSGVGGCQQPHFCYMEDIQTALSDRPTICKKVYEFHSSVFETVLLSFGVCM
jgi:hypothetical protein